MGNEQSKDVSGSTPPDRLAEIESRVEAADRLACELIAARSAGKKMRLGFIIAVLVVLFLYGMAFRGMMRRVGEELQGRAGGEIVQIIFMKEIQPAAMKTFRKVLPDFRKAFEEKGKEIMPKFAEKIQPELDKLVTNVEHGAKKQITDGLKSMTLKQESQLQEHFPELKDPKKVDAVIDNLNLAMGGAAGEVLVGRIEKAYDAIEAVYKRMIRFLPDDKRGLQRRMNERAADDWDYFLKQHLRVRPRTQ